MIYNVIFYLNFVMREIKLLNKNYFKKTNCVLVWGATKMERLGAGAAKRSPAPKRINFVASGIKLICLLDIFNNLTFRPEVRPSHKRTGQ